MKRILISELKENELSKISGFIETIRDTKYMIFIMLKDRTGKIQVSIEKSSNPELVKQLDGVLANSVASFTGKMVISEYVKQGGKEFLPDSLEILVWQKHYLLMIQHQLIQEWIIDGLILEVKKII